jgi:hypothetical protein
MNIHQIIEEGMIIVASEIGTDTLIAYDPENEVLVAYRGNAAGDYTEDEEPFECPSIDEVGLDTVLEHAEGALDEIVGDTGSIIDGTAEAVND